MAGCESVCFASSNIVIVSVVVLLLAGLPGLLLPSARAGQSWTAVMITLAALAGIPASVLTLLSHSRTAWELSWSMPSGPAQLVLDPLAALFLLPIFLISACGALYALRYRPARGGYDRIMSSMYALLAGSMAVIVLAGDSLLFLVAWEGMALSCYLLLIADHHQHEVRDAGTLYLIATHTGTLVLIALFALLYQRTGSFVLPASGSLSAVGPASATIFLLALLGFGTKAGLMPLHVWLPSAHANAPSHASAIMSGVILKMGIYGIVRTVTLFDSPPLWWGLTLLALGIVSALAGVAFALGQHDLKRLLAYHSIENIGIICMGLGVGLCGLSLGRPGIALLGLAGGLLHVLNHAIFKALLFLGAGAVIHVSASRELNRMGGLVRVMPRTGLFFLVGAAAICGLPPLNGFVSELLVYLGLFRQVMGESGSAAVLAALAIPALAVVGGLAVACFVKVFGVVFLGSARQPLADDAHEPGWPMLLPMGLLALLCLLIGLAPVALAPLLEAAVSWHPLLQQESLRLAGA
ncbi:MAG: proton-conducting transporter membrane subunit, partial [Geobacter sp.]